MNVWVSVVTVYDCMPQFHSTHVTVHISHTGCIYICMNKCILPSSHTPGIQLKKGEAKGSKNMMGASGGGEHGGGRT